MLWIKLEVAAKPELASELRHDLPYYRQPASRGWLVSVNSYHG
jgi:hypothetical protein